MGLDRSDEEMDEVEGDVVGGRKAEVDIVGDEGAACLNGSPWRIGAGIGQCEGRVPWK